MTILTDEFVRLCNKKIPDWGYGDVYVRLYAKKVGEKIKYEVRTYEDTTNKSNYTYSNNTYITLQGKKLMENGKLYAYAPNYGSKVNSAGEYVVATHEQIAWGTELIFELKTYALSSDYSFTTVITRPDEERENDGTALIYKAGYSADGVGQLRYKVKKGVLYIQGGACGSFTTATYTQVTYEPLPEEYFPSVYTRAGACGETSGGAVVPCIAEYSIAGHIRLGFRNTAKAPNKIDFSLRFPI